ncbi:hypothetical protein G9A89_018883 [Geosiphon pyriformis]|nr:hypothetical protein G9A89_018883 [Geosiphon pyriformis]
MVKCHYWTTLLVLKQSQKKKQLDESDNKKSEKKDKQEETTELAYTIFTSNSKPLDNVKADKKRIMVNGKLICWPYYDILRKTFDKKPGKKAKYSYWWHGPYARYWYNKPLYSPKPISLISREELKEVQKFFESKPSEIQLLVIE